jgi:hypothetical protein
LTDPVQLPRRHLHIFGKWRGSNYSFITRYRSGFPENRGEEFDAPFTRLDHAYERTADGRFDLMWRRGSGGALRLIATDLNLPPHI